MLNRRRMLIANSKDAVRKEIEIETAGTLICAAANEREYIKKYSGIAIAGTVIFSGGWNGPLLVSKTQTSVVYTVPGFGDKTSSNHFIYDGDTYYVSSRDWFMSRTMISDYPRINSISGVSRYSNDNDGSIQAAKDLLDYYYRVIGD